MKKILGIDEAGRGPLIGPMVLAGVYGIEQELHELGVADSKTFTSKSGLIKRAELYDIIKEKATTVVKIVPAEKIDSFLINSTLNELERQTADEIITEILPNNKIIADGKNLFSKLADKYPFLLAIDKADTMYSTVSAASIIAKEVRDRQMNKIYKKYEKEFGPIKGKGYNNKATKDFINSYYKKYKKLPIEVRKSWNASGLVLE